MGFLCLPLLSPVGVSRCLPSSPVVEEGARASGPPNGPPDGCPMSKKYFRSYCTNGSTYPDYGCRKYFFSAESFLLAIFYLEFPPKWALHSRQYELCHLWGSYNQPIADIKLDVYIDIIRHRPPWVRVFDCRRAGRPSVEGDRRGYAYLSPVRVPFRCGFVRAKRKWANGSRGRSAISPENSTVYGTV